jgi:eukaryotic-like serine/threonine-protein kinase
MSPEQIQSKLVDRRADIWSLGVILFRALSDSYPFEGDTPLALAVAALGQKPRDLATLVPDAPPGLANVVLKALERDLDQRYPTMRAFAEALAPFGPPSVAAIASSLTDEVAQSTRISGQYPRPPSASMLDTEVAPSDGAHEIDVPIDVEPTEQQTRGTWTEASRRSELPNHSRPRRALRWATIAAAVIAALGLAAAVAARVRNPDANANAPTVVRAPPAVSTDVPTPPPTTNPAPAASAPVIVRAPPAASSVTQGTPPPPSRATVVHAPVTPPAGPPSHKPAPAAPSSPPKNPSYL